MRDVCSRRVFVLLLSYGKMRGPLRLAGRPATSRGVQIVAFPGKLAISGSSRVQKSHPRPLRRVSVRVSKIGCCRAKKSTAKSRSNRACGTEVSVRDFGGRFAHRRFLTLSSTIFDTSSRRRASTAAVCPVAALRPCSIEAGRASHRQEIPFHDTPTLSHPSLSGCFTNPDAGPSVSACPVLGMNPGGSGDCAQS